MDPVDISEKFQRGEEVKSHQVTRGEWIRCRQCKYEGGEADVAGKVQHIQVDGTCWEVHFTPTGSQCEEVVKYCT